MLAPDRNEELLVASKQGTLLQDSWENLLGFRISLQRVVEEANKLPAISTESAKLKDKDRVALQEAQDILKGTFTSLYGVLKTKKDEEEEDQLDESDDEDDSADKDIEEIFEKALQRQQARQGYWEEVIDVWNSRVHFGSEKTKNKLKLFNQSPWNQIETVMSNEKRVLEKSRPQVEDSRRVGLKEELDIIQSDQNQRSNKREHGSIWIDNDDENDFDDDEDEENTEMKEQNNKNKKRKMLDLEVYDDRQFYSLLLKNFITSKAGRTSDGLLSASEAKHLSALKALRKKKDVDRKASKGRKIRYNVHDKLKNFMFPIPTQRNSEIDPQRIFDSLFQ